MQKRNIAMALMLPLALGLAGCGGATLTATARVPVVPSLYGYSVTYAGAVPTDIYGYPSVYWNGSYAYWVDDAWYYPTSSGWVVFVEEPWDLYQYRRNWSVQVARPRPTRPPQVEYGYPSSPPVQVAPPAQRGRPPVQVAPPRRR